MPLPFDTDAENRKIADLHEEEEEDLARIMAEKHGTTYADLRAAPVDAESLRIVPETKAREAEAVPFLKTAKELSLAYQNPDNEALAPLVEDLQTRGYTVKEYLVSKKSFEKVVARYGELSFAVASRQGVIAVPQDVYEPLSLTLQSRAAIRTHLDELIATPGATQVSTLVEAVLVAALTLGASDIHLEPEDGGARLRFRLDGALADIYMFTPEVYHLINSRLKILSSIKLNIKDRAQDGRFSIEIGTREIEVRVSAIPGEYGESFVMRLLDPESIRIDLESLGIHPKLLERLYAEIKRPNGMLLTTGPTGSGKTTTLYAFLQRVMSPETKVITIEDPIEYHLPGIVQTQANTKEYTFAQGLRSIVRQDPDVIMVGEIRDAETAGIAIQAALTGHFVYSTLHTNDAAGTFPRLVDLGADPKEFASAISVAMAQRLVRKLDPAARKEVPLEGEARAMVEKVLATISDKSLLPSSIGSIWVPDPIAPEENGYKGRVGLYEAVFVDDAMGQFLRDNPSASDIRKQAAKQGYLTMLQDGVLKALAGVTSLEEVLSVADLPRD